LPCFTRISSVCTLVLIGFLNGQAIAVDQTFVLFCVEVVLYRSIRQAMNSADQGVLLRTLGSFACLVLEQTGALILFVGSAWGLYLFGIGMMSSFIFMVTVAWLLLVGARRAAVAAARAAGRAR